MLDEHKYSSGRVIAYRHDRPAGPDRAYGPGGPKRTFGRVVEVLCLDDPECWQYTVRNIFTGEVRRIAEEDIFHGADREYLDLRRRDDIRWLQGAPDSLEEDASGRFWKRTLSHFVRTAIPRITENERTEQKERTEGRNLELLPGDYIRVRGNLRECSEAHHNRYAKVLAVRASDVEQIEVPKGKAGLAPGRHRVQFSYHVLLDDGCEADFYDIEVKTLYTTNGRSVILNWRAAQFLAEAFGDDPPYDVQMEYLNGHVFSRSELSQMNVDELAELLTWILYAKGLVVHSEMADKVALLTQSPREYLVDQILAYSRFDMSSNRELTDAEIEATRSQETRLRGLLEE